MWVKPISIVLLWLLWTVIIFIDLRHFPSCQKELNSCYDNIVPCVLTLQTAKQSDCHQRSYVYDQPVYQPFLLTGNESCPMISYTRQWIYVTPGSSAGDGYCYYDNDWSLPPLRYPHRDQLTCLRACYNNSGTLSSLCQDITHCSWYPMIWMINEVQATSLLYFFVTVLGWLPWSIYTLHTCNK